MDNPNNYTDSQTRTLELTQQDEFVIRIAPSEQLKRLNQYQLKAADIISDYVINQDGLTELNQYTTPSGESLKCIEAILSWPKKLNWVQFNQHLEALQHTWLLDYQEGVSIDALFLLARSLVLQSTPQHEISQLRFQSFLLHTLSSITHAYDQHQYRFIQHFDIETELPNQQLLLNTLQEYALTAEQQSNTNRPKIGVLSINLNINFEDASHLGQQLSAMSAEIVNAAVSVIQQNLNKDANLFRTSTQELVLIVQQLKFPAQMQLIASRLAHAFERELPIEKLTLILTPYFGGVCSLEQNVSPLSLLESAKMALHQGIISGQQTSIFNHLITSASFNQQQLDEAIIRALQQSELDLYIQPLINLRYGNQLGSHQQEYCASGEFLLRWPQHKHQGIVSPTRLIDTIYKKGFGRVFVRWLINTACRRCAELMQTHQRQFTFTINLSSSDLLDEDLPELLIQSIGLWNIPAEHLILEITETDVMVNEELVSKVLSKIVNLGFKLALDDFGTGYSSMARLRNMPIQLVKIDQSFVRNLAQSAADKAIVQSILELSHSLGKEVVAEGVENLDCLNTLKEMQCDKIQGYYYAKPMPFEDFMPWLTQFEASRAP